MGNNNSDTSKNKNHKKIIICALIVLGLIICGVICLLVFMPSRTDQAFMNFRDTIKSVIDPDANTDIKHKNIVAEATLITIDSKGGSSKNLNFKVQGNNEKAYLEVGVPDGLEGISEEAGFKIATTKEGEFYLKIEGINSIVEDDSYAATFSQIDEIISIKNVLKEIDGTWLYISAPEIEENYSSLGENILTCFAEEYKNRGIIKKAEENYEINKFFSYEEYKDSDITPVKSGKIYEVKIDSNKLSTFIKSVSKNASDKAKQCIGTSSEEYNKNALDSFEPSIDEKTLPKIYVEIVDTDIVYAKIISSDKKNEIDVNISYPEKIDVPELEKKKSIIDLMNEITSGINL